MLITEFYVALVVIYPWGSGEDPYQGATGFLGEIGKLRSQGLSDVEIAKGFKMTTTQFRAAKTIARNEKKQADISMAERLKAKGMSNVAIGERMGINESSVRSLLAPGVKDRADILTATSNMLRDQVAEKKYIDIGAGTEHYAKVSRTKLNAAVAVLKEEGYKVYYIKVPQLGTGKNTTQTVLVPPGTTYSEVYKNRSEVKNLAGYSDDGGRTQLGIDPPISVSSKRVGIKYQDEGGAQADGVVYVRRGKEDLSLGRSGYAQVRIAVDGTHYIKGMAMYKDDLPDGVDLLVNVNKKNTGNKLDALKAMKDDEDNPFGAVVTQIRDPKTKKVTSAMNIVNEEGDWDEWSRTFSSQMLSKQSPNLAKEQLRITQERKQAELDEIMQLTNPAVRRKLLASFADGADTAAVHLKAAALKGTASHVILPINSMKDNEIYAPNYRDGERVALVRFPHGGIFEIPELTVNNRSPEAKKAIGRAKDAVGINYKVAQRLSGADFDGDTVLVIPNKSKKIKSAPPLEGLKDFDPIALYPAYEGMPRMSPKTKQTEMGLVSNLITDMTIRGANTSELARAVRHSMVVIDAEKHNLDYKRSARDNGIAALKQKYQYDPDNPRSKGGASTLISRAGSDVRVLDRKARPASDGGPIDRVTGKKVFVETGEGFTNSKGQFIKKTIKSKKLAETDDANTLSSGTPIEKIYADHSNRLKNMANQARLAMINTKSTPYSESARKAYAKEVADLTSKLRVAQKNAPLERQAQVLANAVVAAKTRANPGMESSDLKKIKAQALAEMRVRTGAHKQRIKITDSEWAAIQAGAISNDMLNKILTNADLDRVKALATPRSTTIVTTAKQSRARSMAALGYTQAEIADALGVSTSTVKTILSG